MDKDAVEPVQISGLPQPTFFGFKTRQPLETYSRSEQAKPFGDHQDPLQQGEWVTSIDFKDTYFHIPIQEQSRKCLRFHIQGRAYQFKALPFSLSSAPLEFTVIPKEVKLMAIYRDLRIHQYLYDWLVRARSHQACLQHTQKLVNNVSATGLAGELGEIRAGAQTRLWFCRLPIRPQVWSGPTDSGPVAEPSRENAETAIARSWNSCPW